MNKRIAVVATTVVGLLLASNAGAQTRAFNEARVGATYFNRPGATVDQHHAALEHCSRYLLAPPGPDAPVNDSIMSRLIWGGTVDRYIQGTNLGRLETCMVAKGWRVYRAPAGAETYDAEALSGWIGAQTPPGSMERWWGNEGARPQGVPWVGNANPPGTASLSLQLLEAWQKARGAAPAAQPPAVTYQALKKNRDLRIGAIPEGMAVIVFKVLDSGRDGGLVGLVQTPPNEDYAGPLNFLQGPAPYMFNKRQGLWYAFTVPAGRWMLGETGRYSFCLGAPSFDVPAGAVVYAGSFDLGGANLGPDLDLAPARARLGAAADRVQAAVYDQNGGVFPCIFFGPPYALELDGAAFPDDYDWGSRAGLGSRAAGS